MWGYQFTLFEGRIQMKEHKKKVKVTLTCMYCFVDQENHSVGMGSQSKAELSSPSPRMYLSKWLPCQIKSAHLAWPPNSLMDFTHSGNESQLSYTNGSHFVSGQLFIWPVIMQNMAMRNIYNFSRKEYFETILSIQSSIFYKYRNWYRERLLQRNYSS